MLFDSHESRTGSDPLCDIWFHVLCYCIIVNVYTENIIYVHTWFASRKFVVNGKVIINSLYDLLVEALFLLGLHLHDILQLEG